MTVDVNLDFTEITIDDLEHSDKASLNSLTFGVIGLGRDNICLIYNRTESQAAGLSPERVIGTPFFLTTAPCMNNFLVAQRFVDEPELDSIIDYVLTLRMRPTPVRLRLLQSSTSMHRYILVQRK
ncbi:MAG: phosphonate transporter [Proteobacteria bacterium]|nr:phosphonate transporter [Pseudomonadota bacterium]